MRAHTNADTQREIERLTFIRKHEKIVQSRQQQLKGSWLKESHLAATTQERKEHKKNKKEIASTLKRR